VQIVNRLSSFIAITLFWGATSITSGFAQRDIDKNCTAGKPIYTEDNRDDVERIECFPHGAANGDSAKLAILREKMQMASRATVLITSQDELTKQSDGSYLLQLREYSIRANGRDYPVCSDQRFYDQKTVLPACTGFLVAPDIVVTAGHCVKAISKLSVVFGFNIVSDQLGGQPQQRREFSTAEVFSAQPVDGPKDGLDYAILKLSAPVPDTIAKPVAVGTSPDDLMPGAIVGVIGHPDGLPKKFEYSSKSRTKPNTEAQRTKFDVLLDTFDGNSGSPIYLYDNPDRAVGILIEGANDFQNNRHFDPADGGKTCVKYCVIDGSQTDQGGDTGCTGSLRTEIGLRLSAIPNLENWIGRAEAPHAPGYTDTHPRAAVKSDSDALIKKSYDLFPRELADEVAAQIQTEANEEQQTTNKSAATFYLADKFYETLRTGMYSGVPTVKWNGFDHINDRPRFIFEPQANQQFSYKTSNGKLIVPKLMDTDGGTSPLALHPLPKFSPWGYAPAYIIHDWVFVSHKCAIPPDNDVEFQESALIIAEAIKTLMEIGYSDYDGNKEKFPKAEDTLYLIYRAVNTPYAKKMWNNLSTVKCR
jgi:V8-like Glu-specific endopeptidase